MTPNCIFAL